MEYPRMLYRPGSQYRVWDEHDVDTLIVDSPDEQAKAEAAGWNISPEPLDHDGDGRKGGSLPRKKGSGK